MTIEHEAKILDIDPEVIERLILEAGGVKIGRRLFRRNVYDITPGDMSTWIRLRDDGIEVTLTTKKIEHDGIDGTREVEVVVDDFDKASDLLEMMGFKSKAYQENRRDSYILEGANVEVDRWPLIPPYVEVEASSKADVIRIAGLLGHSESHLTGENTTKVYARYGIDLTSISDLRF